MSFTFIAGNLPRQAPHCHGCPSTADEPMPQALSSPCPCSRGAAAQHQVRFMPRV